MSCGEYPAQQILSGRSDQRAGSDENERDRTVDWTKGLSAESLIGP